MKTIYRTLMNETLREPLSGLYGRVLDLASGHAPSYMRWLTRPDVELASTDARGLSDTQRIDFNKPLPYADAWFDHALCINALYVAEDPIATLKELRRVVKNDGLVIFVTPFIFPEAREPHDYCRWTSEGAERLARESGFRTVSLQPFGGYATSALAILEPMLYFRFLKAIAQGVARAFDGLVPRSLRDRHPCPLGYVVICHR